MTMFRIPLQAFGAIMAAGALLAGLPAAAQVRTFDPDMPIDGDLMPVPQPASPAPVVPAAPVEPAPAPPLPAGSPAGSPAGTPGAAEPGAAGTYRKDDLIGAAEGVFGKGAKGLAELIEDLLKKQGEPNAYIVGREAGGAFIFGLLYGSGTLYHKIEGQRPVYWTGPSIGIDAGANAASTFVLVYNLHNTDDLYRRFGAGEGQAYLIGGFHVSYVRDGDKVLIPVRSGAGLRLGINAGYMKFSRKQRWVPF
ncbi:MAG TPA: DUF1134 domain-containing protein [Novosphingobium sp.]|nr:DUF1134 domain-containing protein [Novosphingobium sp.]